MAEGPIHKASTTELKECLHLIRDRPYILQLALSAGIGGILFGYDTGVIAGALLYIRDDFPLVDKSAVLEGGIVGMAVAGAIVGAGFGGWMSDRFGRRPAILFADVLFFVGALVMAFAKTPEIIILGRLLVGFGVGMASMTSPLYISEASPAKIRGALVSLNALLVTGGQFLAYLDNLAFTKAPGTWRWMLGVAAFPAAVQFVLMLMLPESPRWLYRKGGRDKVEDILTKIYPAEEVDQELDSMQQAVKDEMNLEGTVGSGTLNMIEKAWNSTVVRRGLGAGILCQVAQQFAGINIVMYYSSTIFQKAGYGSNKTALALSLITSGLNAGGTIVSMFFVDRVGRRKLLIISLVGVICSLGLLSGAFHKVATHSPDVSAMETRHYSNHTCPEFNKLASGVKWTCVDCLEASSVCGFCSHEGLGPGACLLDVDIARDACLAEQRQWYTHGCPSNYNWLTLLGLGAFIIAYSPGMGTVPWVINSEIYPLRFRGFCGGLAAVTNWISNLIVTLAFIALTIAIGTALTFLLFCGVSCVFLVLIYFVVPETKGLQFEEVEMMLESNHYSAWRKGPDMCDYKCKGYVKT